jgi:hypothetical protein
VVALAEVEGLVDNVVDDLSDVGHARDFLTVFLPPARQLDLGSNLQNPIFAEKFSDKFSS